MLLVLASASPRRAELLRAAGFDFEILVVDVDEAAHPGEKPEDYVRRLAMEKSARAMEITDKDRQEKWATQATIKEGDVGQMVEGQNVYRRARGEEEITEGDAQRAGSERQRESIDRTRDE